MVNKELMEWLERNKSKGYPRDYLVKYLTNYGYSQEDIDEAFRSLDITPSESTSPKQAIPEKPAAPAPSLETLATSKTKASGMTFWNHIRHRNIFYLTFMTICTLGVYWFYFFWRTSKEIDMATGEEPRRMYLIPGMIFLPALFTIAMMLFIASEIDTRASRTFIQYGSLIWIGLLLIFLIVMGTFFWTYATAVEPIIHMPAWLNFTLLITILPSILIMIFTQNQLNMKALEIDRSPMFTRQKAYLQREHQG